MVGIIRGDKHEICSQICSQNRVMFFKNKAGKRLITDSLDSVLEVDSSRVQHCLISQHIALIALYLFVS